MIRQDKGRLNDAAGRAAEAQVSAYYTTLGHVVVAERWRGTAGEVDLILQDGPGFIFVEV